jgi:GDP-4-dehydro-6-deoxy-D-mannose reductase
MRILVTGAGGFAGRHLVAHLSENRTGSIYCSSLTPREDGFTHCDLTRAEDAKALIQEVGPDQIYHMVGTNTDDYHAAYEINVATTRNILESVVQAKRRCRVLLVGSSAEYGPVSEADNPVSEDQRLIPMGNYALTKIYQTYLMKLYCASFKTDIVMARPFNLYGRGMSNRLFVGRVHQQIAQFKVGQIPKISVGNLDNKRDYISIQSAVSCFSLIMEKGETGEIYNVGSGVAIRMRDLLERMLQEEGLDMSVVEERTFAEIRQFDVKNLIADTTKLMKLDAGDPSLGRALQRFS